MEKILITGCAGFIGMHLSKKLLENGFKVVGVDNLNNYYSPRLKKDRLLVIQEYKNFKFFEGSISDKNFMNGVFQSTKPQKVVNLAAQAGVRYSIENPDTYIKSNIVGFMNILEECRRSQVDGLIYASSSSVYGGNKNLPFKVSDKVDKPISIYAASKKANELMAHAYSHLYGLHSTGLRFFTVYGPWGRPDMAIYKFSEKILKGEPIEVFNNGKMGRDFTYIEDIISGVISSIEKNYKNEIFNLGNSQKEDLMEMISLIEKSLGKKAKIIFKKLQPGDVGETYANIEYSQKMLNFEPKTSIKLGIPKFIKWYKGYISQ